MSKRTIQRFLKNNHNILLEKHELTQKQRNNRLKFWKEYIDHDFSQTIFIDETLFWVGKLSKENREKHEILYIKHAKR